MFKIFCAGLAGHAQRARPGRTCRADSRRRPPIRSHLRVMLSCPGHTGLASNWHDLGPDLLHRVSGNLENSVITRPGRIQVAPASPSVAEVAHIAWGGLRNLGTDFDHLLHSTRLRRSRSWPCDWGIRLNLCYPALYSYTNLKFFTRN